jgi:class I fructose-bisphosphate aldolase
MAIKNIIQLLGDKADYLLNHTSETIDKSALHFFSPNDIDEIWINSNRNNTVLRNFQSLLNFGRLAGTGCCNVFPVDRGIEHSAGSAFAPNPIYFDPQIL